MNERKSNWIAILFFLFLVLLVFQQIATSMTEQGIAEGGAYENASTYPKFLAIIIGVILIPWICQELYNIKAIKKNNIVTNINQVDMKSGLFFIFLFILYLYALPYLGYQLLTPVFMASILMILNSRNKISHTVCYAVLSSVIASFFFEGLLNIVLPGGYFSIYIPWPNF